MIAAAFRETNIDGSSKLTARSFKMFRRCPDWLTRPGKQPHNELERYGKIHLILNGYINIYQLFLWPFSSSQTVCLPGRVINVAVGFPRNENGFMIFGEIESFSSGVCTQKIYQKVKSGSESKFEF